MNTHPSFNRLFLPALVLAGVIGTTFIGVAAFLAVDLLFPHPTATWSMTLAPPSSSTPDLLPSLTVTPTATIFPTGTLTPTPAASPTPFPSETSSPTPEPTLEPTPAGPEGNCDPSYPEVCIAPSPPDLDCPDIPFRRFKVIPPDPHHFDMDGDGTGCER